MSQFKLWAIMKAPLIIGTNWQQLADLPTLAPDYFKLISNPEIIAVNQDPSPQATLVAQTPSTAQQSNETGLNVTLQLCDLSRPDQRFVSSTTTPAGIALANSTLCLSVNRTGAGTGATTEVMAKPCGIVKDAFSLASDSQLTLTRVEGPEGLCLSDSLMGQGSAIPTLGASLCKVDSPINHHSSSDPVPLFPVANGHDLGMQTFVWDKHSLQIVASASGLCLTVGNPNYDPNRPAGVTYSNHFTLEHEVWTGPLSNSASGAGRRVVALFNKGANMETLSAGPTIIGSDRAAMLVRDIVEQQDLGPIPKGGVLSASVPSHGTRVFVLETAV